MPDFDLTVIGSGPGGYVAAIHAARLGARVAVLEQKDTEWGGTCLNWGCIPAKALVQSAEVLQAVRRAGEFGVRVGPPEVDWPAMQARKDSVVSSLRQGVRGLLKANGIEMITARGRLAGGHRVRYRGGRPARVLISSGFCSTGFCSTGILSTGPGGRGGCRGPCA